MTVNWQKTYAAIWRSNKQYLRPVQDIDPVRLGSLIGIDTQKQQLIRNTKRFMASQPANNALLWGARGSGKSSLIKAVLNEFKDDGLRLIEIAKTDLFHLVDIVDSIRDLTQKFIVYCDDFSFNQHDNTYIALKSVLDGSIELPPANVILYATSNRRHLVPESMQDNANTTVVQIGELHYSDATEEKISLSDRFGLRLSFYQPDMQTYYDIVDSYCVHYRGDRKQLHKAAQRFSLDRGSKSGRTALQFSRWYEKSEN